jgi:DNA-binding GntR family transcriptional regulator
MKSRGRRVVQPERLRDQVYRIILDDMRSGDIVPGQRLYELELAEKYGVSRTPIREALFQLAREGLLVEAERGYVFPKATREDTRNRLEIRLLLEPAIARRAAVEGSSEQVAALGAALQAERAGLEQKSPRAFIAANTEFRKIMRSMCSNSLLSDLASQIDDQFRMFQFSRAAIFHDPANREMTVRDHSGIYKAIKSGDAEEAEASTRQFLMRIMEYFADHPSEADTQ